MSPRHQRGAKGVLNRWKRDRGEVAAGCRGAGGKGQAVGGATGDFGDAVIFESSDKVGFSHGRAGSIALLAVLVVSPGVNLFLGNKIVLIIK